MGRAGAGGYATVQHAYDTRLKRDVAIKCIQISQDDIERSRMSIHDAQIENATRALGGRRQERPRAVQPHALDEAPSGFVPLTSKISEPGFLSSREKYAERRAKRHNFLKGTPTAVKGAYGTGTPDTEDFEGSEDLGGQDGESFDLSDFSQYSNFKGRGNVGHKKAAAGQRRRDMDSYPISSKDTVGLRDFANGIPGRIAGAGEADISAIGEHSIEIGQLHESGMDDRREGAVQSRRNAAQEPPAHDALKARESRSYHDAHGASVIPDAYDESSEHIDPISKMDRIPGLEEARTAAHLNDANIVTVYDCVVEGNMAYVIMEYVEGKTLSRIMRDIGNDITLDMIASVFNSVSHALQVAHKAGILHLDIKPENVIVNNDGVVKVTDFGLSTLMDASGQGETGGGTIGYMPLEQMRQQRLDVRTDEWALASLTYEMLSGKNPFKARSLNDAEAAIEGAELVIPSLCWESIDESIDDIMFDALSPEMDGRYPDIKTFSDDLAPLLGDAREGRTQLAQAVKGTNLLHSEAASAPRVQKPYVPFIDRIGVKGSSILMRVFSALGAAMLGVIALMNFRFAFGEEPEYATEVIDGNVVQTLASGPDTVFGMFSIMPVAAWVILALLVALAAWRPRFAMPAGFLMMVVMLFFNQAWLPGFLLLAGCGAWWWFFGRESDMMCTLAMMQPLFGSVGFAPAVPVLAGALLDIRDAAVTAAMAALSAFVFASFGSCSVMGWDVMSNIIVAVNPSIAGASMASGFVASLSSAQNWVVVASWIMAASIYSLICRRGTHAFDIVASVACAACMVAGMLVVPLVTGDFTTLVPIVIIGTAASALLGIVFALLSVPDRVRMAPGEW